MIAAVPLEAAVRADDFAVFLKHFHIADFAEYLFLRFFLHI